MKGWAKNLLLLGFATLATGCAPPKQPREHPLSHSAYVWKQGWDRASGAALTQCALPPEIGELTVLVGETGLGSVDRAVRPPWPALKEKSVRVSLCVRIGIRPGQAGRNDVDLGAGLELLRRGVSDAQSAGIAIASVQIDYDCPTRLLSAYARRVQEFKATVAPLPVTITAVPSWLDSADLRPLVEAADGWTLQVHATTRPSLSRPAPLFAESQALRWIEQACRLKRPFKVALPTYAYLACFSDKGTYLGVRAESGDRPPGTARTQPLAADPAEVIGLLQKLDDQKFALVEGLAWFRLPFTGERQNWTLAGLAKVIGGQPLGHDLDLQVKTKGPLHDISLHNPTEQPLPLPSVVARWKGASVVGADGTLDWEARPIDGGVKYVRREDGGFLAPGERRVVGWLRLSSTAPVAVRTSE